MQLNLSINTDSPADVARARQILDVLAPAAPAAVPAALAPVTVPQVSVFPPIPPGAPAGAAWAQMPGAPALVDRDGTSIALDWSDPRNPKIAPPRVYTHEELAAQQQVHEAAAAMAESLGLNLGGKS